MPDRVTQRLQAVIANEVAMRAAGVAAASGAQAPAPGTGPATHTPGRPDLPSRRGGHRARRLGMPGWMSPLLLRGLSAAGALVILIGGGIFLVTRGGPQARSSAGSAAPANQPARPAPSHSGVNLGTAGGGTESLRYRTTRGYAYAETVHTLTNFSSRNLAVGVRKEIASSPAVGAPVVGRPNAVQLGDGQARNHRIGGFSVVQLESCMGFVADGHPVLLADVARYQGKPAVIVVLKPVGQIFSVVVAGLACGTGGGDVLRRLSIPKG